MSECELFILPALAKTTFPPLCLVRHVCGPLMYLFSTVRFSELLSSTVPCRPCMWASHVPFLHCASSLSYFPPLCVGHVGLSCTLLNFPTRPPKFKHTCGKTLLLKFSQTDKDLRKHRFRGKNLSLVVFSISSDIGRF